MTETTNPPDTMRAPHEKKQSFENLNMDELPSPDTLRWDTKRKAQVVEAVRSGRLSLNTACSIYAMSVDEFLAWQSLFDRYGKNGLMATRVKEYRRPFQRKR